MIEDLKSSVQGMINAIPGTARSLLGIQSPSTVFAGIGENISLGLAAGIKGAATVPQAEVAALVTQPLTTTTTGGAAEGMTRPSRTLQVNGPLVSITVPEGSGAEDVAARSRSSVLATLRACGYA